MRSLLQATLVVAVVLLVPVLPFLFLGDGFEGRVEDWLAAEWAPEVRFGLIAGLLATDIFLPVPSSAVSTYGGGILGTWPATLASWVGMTVGACLGFGLARLFGRPFAERFAGRSDLQRMQAATRRFGPLVLVLTRALPILAEACVLLMGATRLSWRRFLIPVLTSNLVISLVYAAFGEYFQGRNALPVAVVASGAVPLGVALLARRWLPLLGLEQAEY